MYPCPKARAAMYATTLTLASLQNQSRLGARWALLKAGDVLSLLTKGKPAFFVFLRTGRPFLAQEIWGEKQRQGKPTCSTKGEKSSPSFRVGVSLRPSSLHEPYTCHRPSRINLGHVLIWAITLYFPSCFNWLQSLFTIRIHVSKAPICEEPG